MNPIRGGQVPINQGYYGNQGGLMGTMGNRILRTNAKRQRKPAFFIGTKRTRR